MKYRLIKTSNNIIVITADGGIADIHFAEELDAGDGRQSTTEYYQTRFTEEDLHTDESVWEAVAEGKAYYNFWKTPFDAKSELNGIDPFAWALPAITHTPYHELEHVQDALVWLSDDIEFELDESIWPNFKG